MDDQMLQALRTVLQAELQPIHDRLGQLESDLSDFKEDFEQIRENVKGFRDEFDETREIYRRIQGRLRENERKC